MSLYSNRTVAKTEASSQLRFSILCQVDRALTSTGTQCSLSDSGSCLKGVVWLAEWPWWRSTLWSGLQFSLCAVEGKPFSGRFFPTNLPGSQLFAAGHCCPSVRHQASVQSKLCPSGNWPAEKPEFGARIGGWKAVSPEGCLRSPSVDNSVPGEMLR